jgi:membrane protein YqaA with SNARE-associated domain
MSDVAKPRGLRAMYAWTMRNAEGPHAWRVLALVSFAESSFFPLPPDLMLLPMVLARPKAAFRLAAWCTLWSVLGGILGYAIGALLFDSVGSWLVRLYHLQDGMADFQNWYAQNGAWVILLKGLTPIPYKLVTITSGFAHYNLVLFVLLSVITRGARFGVLAGLLYWKGEAMRPFIEKYLEWVLLGFLTIIVLGVVLVKYVL